MDDVLALDYTLDDVIEWLDDHPPHTNVHGGDDNICAECTVARFLQDKLNDPSISVGFVTATSNRTGVLYSLLPEIASAIHTLDERAGNAGGLTASEAKAIVEQEKV